MLDPRVEDIVRRLRAKGVASWLVGGAVRDLILGRPSRDLDVLVEIPLEETARLLPRAVRVGRRRPVLVLPSRGGRPRIEIIGPRPPARGLAEDLARRDFTLNAIAFDPVADAFIDPLGGRRDIEARSLVAADRAHGFREDPIRILRGVRLAAELDFTIEDATERAMQREAWRLVGAAGERIRDDLFRILTLARPAPAIRRLREIGALASCLPELLRTVAIGQNRLHPDDVYHHTLRVTNAVPPEPMLRLAAALHDVAKPETKLFAKTRGDFTFLRHELAADRHVGRVASRLRLSRRERADLAGLVRHHLLFPERLRTDRAIRRMLARVGSDILPGLLELRRADLASRSKTGEAPPAWGELVRRIDEVRTRERAKGGPRLRLSGADVMGTLGIPEGPEVGRWLGRARRRILDRPEENDRSRLIAWLRRAAREEDPHGCTRI